MKLTIASMCVAWAIGQLLEKFPEEVYGLRICELSGMPSGTVYPILGRMEKEGLVEIKLKSVHYSKCGRRVQHHYTLTDTGYVYLNRACERLARMHLL